MIHVTLYKNKDGEIYRFVVLNHGEAIVCAGVSALVITCVNFIQSRFGVGVQSHDEGGGYIDFEISGLKDDVLIKEIALIIDQMVFGLEQIRESYKKEVKIKIRKE